mmetsp:Transcript_19310/g.50205  ORF Transcript_19310/g.50205 Transcript_19310/m.50205 type:complete len:204 (+) Transcript_19310:492-1103(+)
MSVTSRITLTRSGWDPSEAASVSRSAASPPTECSSAAWPGWFRTSAPIACTVRLASTCLPPTTAACSCAASRGRAPASAAASCAEGLFEHAAPRATAACPRMAVELFGLLTHPARSSYPPIFPKSAALSTWCTSSSRSSRRLTTVAGSTVATPSPSPLPSPSPPRAAADSSSTSRTSVSESCRTVSPLALISASDRRYASTRS